MSTAPLEFFVFVYRRGPGWLADRSLDEQPLAEHRAYMDRLFAEGCVLYGGPFLDTEGGGITAVHAVDRAHAETMLAADPATRDGVFVGTVRPWLPVFDRGRV